MPSMQCSPLRLWQLLLSESRTQDKQQHRDGSQTKKMMAMAGNTIACRLPPTGAMLCDFSLL